MKTQYYTAASLDGFIADQGHGLDWLFQFDVATDYAEFVQEVGAIAMGSSTYAWVLADLARQAGDGAQVWPYTQPTWVFTTRDLPSVAGADLRFVRGEVRPVHEDMVAVAGDKNVWLVGGGELAAQFYDARLLDELIVTVAPVTLGEGAALFPRALTTPPLRLASVRSFGGVFAQLTYEVPRGGR